MSRRPRFMLTVTFPLAGIDKLCACKLKLSKLRLRLAKPATSLNPNASPVTDKLPLEALDCGACKSSFVTPAHFMASLWPANKPDKKFTDVLLALTWSEPTLPCASASKRMPLRNSISWVPLTISWPPLRSTTSSENTSLPVAVMLMSPST